MSYIVLCTQLCCVPSRVQLFATPWSIAWQTLLSMEFSKQEYWSWLPFPTPWDLPHPGIKPLVPPALEGQFFTTVPPRKYKLQLGSAVCRENPRNCSADAGFFFCHLQKSRRNIPGLVWQLHGPDIFHSSSLLSLVPCFLQGPRNLHMAILVNYPQFSSVAQSCLTLCDPMESSTPGLPVHHQLPEPTQAQFHWVGDAIWPSLPLSSPSPPAFDLPQHQGLFQWVSSSHQVAKVLEFQLQHQSFHWTPRTDLL